jgi:rhodanese-related sulfurtransferase
MRNMFLWGVVILLLSCTQQESNIDLTPKTFNDKIENDTPRQLVDVRTSSECAMGVISDAQNIDFHGDDFKGKLMQLDRSVPVYVYCASGGRSTRAAHVLKELGFTEIYNLSGGMKAWQDAGYEVNQLEE